MAHQHRQLHFEAEVSPVELNIAPPQNSPCAVHVHSHQLRRPNEESNRLHGPPRDHNPNRTIDRKGLDSLPVTILGRIIFGHLDHIPSRNALVRACPSITRKIRATSPLLQSSRLIRNGL